MSINRIWPYILLATMLAGCTGEPQVYRKSTTLDKWQVNTNRDCTAAKDLYIIDSGHGGIMRIKPVYRCTEEEQ